VRVPGSTVVTMREAVDRATKDPIDDPAVIAQILAHLGLLGARDGPEPASSMSPPRDDQPTLPLALLSATVRRIGRACALDFGDWMPAQCF